jgi:hypothetical protein
VKARVKIRRVSGLCCHIAKGSFRFLAIKGWTDMNSVASNLRETEKQYEVIAKVLKKEV